MTISEKSAKLFYSVCINFLLLAIVPITNNLQRNLAILFSILFFFFGNPFTFLQDIIRIFETFVNSKLKLDNIFLENQFIIDIYKRLRLDMNRHL